MGEPLQIVSVDREPAGWFVPLVDGEFLVAFLQFDERLTLLRHSRFPRPVDRRLWLDADAIAQRATSTFPDAQPVAAPFLTYDGNITRIAWALPVAGGTIFVAGDYAYYAAT